MSENVNNLAVGIGIAEILNEVRNTFEQVNPNTLNNVSQDIATKINAHNQKVNAVKMKLKNPEQLLQ